MADAVCSKCDVEWVIHPHDKYCGYCGCEVFDFSIKWKEEPLIYASDGANIRDLTVLIENKGASPITFQPIRTTRDNTILFPQANDSPFEVEAGKCRAVPIQVKLANLERYHEVITVRTQDAPSDFESEKSLRLQVLLTPEFRLTPNPVVVRHRRGAEQATIDLRFEVLQSRFTIKSIRFSPQCVKKIQCKRGPYEKDSAAKDVSLDIDCNQLNNKLNVVKLRFELNGFSEPIEKQIHIQREVIPEPPKLFVPPMNLDITQERKKTHTLALQNRGERPLTIQNIVFDSPSNIVQLPNVEFPLSIEGSEHHNIEMQISAVGIKPETYPVNFTINSNCEDASEYEGILDVNVKELEDYPHYLAIDFGTTNSCCAYLDLDTDAIKLVHLDSRTDPIKAIGYDPHIIPSLIFYRSQSKNGEDYLIGYDAKGSHLDETEGHYCIRSVKRWLGFNWYRQFPNNLELRPRDVVADILEHIIKRSEEHLDTLSTKSKIKKCVVTYPTMFDIKQQEDLKQAFKKVGITDLILIDEASAASLGTIFQRKQQGDYRLLVYDFGGGTIDVVLSQITNDGNDIIIEPLAHSGDPKYGGDDVTQAIVDFVLDECRQRIKKEESYLHFDIPYVNPRKIWQPSGDQQKDRATLLNTSFLYDRSEELKVALSDHDEVNRDFPLSIVVGNDIRPLDILTQGKINVSISREQLRSFLVDKLDQTFADIDTMISENGGHPPEVVILAGQSSKMPMVKKMMTTHFQKKYQTNDVDIQLSESPKECVAIGAAQYGITRSLPSKVWFEIKNFRKTHSSIGIMQADGRQQVFEEIIPKGKLIPDESSGRAHVPLHIGETTIDVRERFGTNDKLSRIDDYILTLPEHIPREALRNACLKMAVEENGEIKVVALVDNDEYPSTVEKKEPAFANEI